MRKILAFSILIFCGCASSQKSGAIPPGPNYSATPCSDNCGTDPTCNASCTPLATSGVQQPITLGTGH
jgi:hypothetical protein